MKFSEFKAIMDSNEESAKILQKSSVFLFEGEDAFFRERGLFVLKNKFIQEPSLNFAVFNGEEGSFDEVVSSINAFPFMSPKRITLIKEFYPKSEGIDENLRNFIDNPQDQSLLIISNEKPSEILKKLNVNYIDCSKADSFAISKWIKAKVNSEGAEIDRETANMIAEYCMCDMARIEMETEKLISYVGSGTIDKEAVETLVAKSNDYKIYEMTDYIAKKKFDLALSVITDMLGKNEAPQKIIVSVYNYFRKLLYAGISGKTATELGTLLGIKEYPAKKTLEQASMFKKRALKGAVDRLSLADYKIKSFNSDEFEQMWLSVFSIMTDNV